MSQQNMTEQDVYVRAQNVGGIEEAEIALSPGVTVLTGRNATNRTSFLQAIIAGLGSDRATLKGDADKGKVELRIGDQTYTRTLNRSGDDVNFSGDPYLEDATLADQFAFLLEQNEARQAVARADDLREIIMRSIDTDSIDEEIRECERDRDNLETEIDRLDSLEQDLPQLESKLRDKRDSLEEARTELESVREEIEDLDTGVKESRTRKQELEEAFQRVRDARSELDDLEFHLETEQSTLAELKSERIELQETISEVEIPDANLDHIDGQIDELRRRKRTLDGDINDLVSVISFNEDMMDGSGIAIDEETTSGDPTAALVEEGQTNCWTCGSNVETNQIEETLERLRDLRSNKLDERNEIRAKLEELSDRKSSIREAEREIERAQGRLDTVEAEIESSESKIDDFEAKLESKREDIEELEEEAKSIDIDGYDEALELHREENRIELRIERLEDEIGEVKSEIDEREAAIERREELELERDELSDRLTELRTRVERIEENAVENFNEHMDTILDILEYENLERIWIERRETEVREGRQKVTRTRFDLHIIRSSADGTAYEDTVNHLSESEREVTGLVFALAGYLVHDVYETVPFMLIDSLEAIDSNRISRIIDHFETQADYLITALLPEDSAALPETYNYIESID